MATIAMHGPAGSRGMSSEERLVIFASSLGTVFEWYDFYIYGTLGIFLAKYFFSNVPANVGFIFPPKASEQSTCRRSQRQAQPADSVQPIWLTPRPCSIIKHLACTWEL